MLSGAVAEPERDRQKDFIESQRWLRTKDLLRKIGQKEGTIYAASGWSRGKARVDFVY